MMLPELSDDDAAVVNKFTLEQRMEEVNLSEQQQQQQRLIGKWFTASVITRSRSHTDNKVSSSFCFALFCLWNSNEAANAATAAKCSSAEWAVQCSQQKVCFTAVHFKLVHLELVVLWWWWWFPWCKLCNSFSLKHTKLQLRQHFVLCV